METIRQEMTKLTLGIADTIGKPREHVHIKYEPDAVGRIAFGGTLVEDD